MAVLYIVSTPIGNLEDVSPRVIETLRSVHTILAEDTRRTGQLLKKYNITTPQLSYHQHSKLQRTEQIGALLEDYDLALVSDAGTPGISDPGQKIIRLAIDQGQRVVPIPGATAYLSALISSGIYNEQFTFLGFLPRSAGKQIDMVEPELEKNRTVVFYESPHRVIKTLDKLKNLIGHRRVCVARELTKIFEEFIRGSADQVISQLKQKQKIKGEIVVVIGEG